MKVFVLFFIFCIPNFANSFDFVPNPFYFSSLKTENLILNKNKNNAYSIALKPIARRSSELFLDFENKIASQLQEKSKKHPILYSDYIVISKNPYEGNTSAACIGKSSKILLANNSKTILGSTQIYDDFSISFALYPKNPSGTLFSKIYFSNGKRYGIQLKIKDYQISFEIFNLFKTKTSTQSLSLYFSDRLERNKWNEVKIHIDTNLKKITGFLNNKARATSQLDRKYDIINFGFFPNDTSPFRLCDNYYGYLDNFRIAKGRDIISRQLYEKQMYNSETKYIENFYGTGVSQVYKTFYSYSFVRNLDFDFLMPKGTQFELYLRFSEKKFKFGDKTKKWLDYDTFNELDKSKMPFQYFQWKIKLKSDYQGQITPSFYGLKLSYFETQPPSPPNYFSTFLFDPRKLKVCFKWKKSLESEVRNGGGYFLYYGVSPERMLYSITNLGKIESLNTEQNKNFVYSCVDNELILQNFKNQNNLDDNVLLLKKGATYYFKLSAYNKFYNTKQRADQKSGQTLPVSVTFLSE